MNIAILGSGGREHALSWKLAQSVPPEQIFTLPGNGGIPHSVPLAATDFPALAQFCQAQQIELIVVGPETPLVAGVVDYFADKDIKVFGPSQAAARLMSEPLWQLQGSLTNLKAMKERALLLLLRHFRLPSVR